MARAAVKNYHYGSRYASYGNLAYDLDRQEREQLLRRAGEMAEPAPQTQAVPRAIPRTAAKTAVRARAYVSPVAVLGMALVALMTVLLLQSYIQMTELSNSVVTMEKELAALQEEHLALTTKYELTFDFTTVKEHAQQAGMKKVSSSQVYYVDLSQGDSAVAYTEEGTSGIKGLLTSLGNGICAVVEYFR